MKIYIQLLSLPSFLFSNNHCYNTFQNCLIARFQQYSFTLLPIERIHFLPNLIKYFSFDKIFLLVRQQFKSWRIFSILSTIKNNLLNSKASFLLQPTAPFENDNLIASPSNAKCAWNLKLNTFFNRWTALFSQSFLSCCSVQLVFFSSGLRGKHLE